MPRYVILFAVLIGFIVGLWWYKSNRINSGSGGIYLFTGVNTSGSVVNGFACTCSRDASTGAVSWRGKGRLACDPNDHTPANNGPINFNDPLLAGIVPNAYTQIPPHPSSCCGLKPKVGGIPLAHGC
jgi:hypothetical protein